MIPSNISGQSVSPKNLNPTGSETDPASQTRSWGVDRSVTPSKSEESMDLDGGSYTPPLEELPYDNFESPQGSREGQSRWVGSAGNLAEARAGDSRSVYSLEADSALHTQSRQAWDDTETSDEQWVESARLEKENNERNFSGNSESPEASTNPSRSESRQTGSSGGSRSAQKSEGDSRKADSREQENSRDLGSKPSARPTRDAGAKSSELTRGPKDAE